MHSARSMSPSEARAKSNGTLRRLVMALGLVSIVGCAHYDIRLIPDPPKELVLHRSQAGVTLMVSHPKDAFATFDANLHGNDIFPVLLFFENHTERTLTVSKRDMTLSGDELKFRQLSAGEVSERLLFSPAGRYFAWSFGLFGIGIVPGIIDHFKAESANQAIWQDILAKELRDFAAGPGDVVKGFVFFDVPGINSPSQFTSIATTSDGQIRRFVVVLGSAQK